MFDVWVQTDNGPEKRPLSYFYNAHADSINRLWFSPGLMPILLKQGAVIDWYQHCSGRLCIPGESPSVLFLVNEMGYINAKCWDINLLPAWHKKFWADNNIVPQGETELDKTPYLPQYPDEGRHFQRWSNPKNAPEARLLLAMEKCEAVFEKIFSLKLFKCHESDAALAKNLHRFRSLDEDGLRGLAVDIYKFCMERLNIGVLEQAFRRSGGSLTDKEKGKGRKLIENLLELCGRLSHDAARNITAPLVGLYDLRNSGGVAHYPPSAKAEDCYRLLNIDRYAPHIEQGAQLLENIAIAFEQIAEVLDKGGDKESEKADGGGQS